MRTNTSSKRIWFSSIVICILHPKSLCIISQLINRYNAHFIYIIFLSKERIFLQLLLHIFYTDQNQIIEIIGYKAFRYLHLATTNSDECLTGVSSRPCPWCDLTRKFARKSTSGANRLPLRNWLPAAQIFTIFLVQSQSAVLNCVNLTKKNRA